MKKIKRIIIFTIAMAFLFSNVVYAEEYRRIRFNANKTNASSSSQSSQTGSQSKNKSSSSNSSSNKGKQDTSSQSSRTGSQSKNKSSSSNKGKQDTSYTNIPRTVINKRNQEISAFINHLEKTRGYSSLQKIIGTYYIPFNERTGGSSSYSGEYKLHLLYNGNDITTTKNTRPKDYTWTIKNESTGKELPKIVTKENYTYITFSVPGTYFIQADETLQYDIYKAMRISVKITASHNGRILQNYTHTGTSKYVETKTKKGKTTTWRVVITMDDLNKKIKIPLGNSGGGGSSGGGGTPINKLNVDIDYELVE